MGNYDFRSLSPHDFEHLCRDLLQKLLGLRLESFTTGRDDGIDFRYRTGTSHLILQCKHYAESGFEALCRVLVNKERKKIEAINPTKYLLATSVGLTPRRKEDLLKILAPYCLASEDIFGKDDLNNLLSENPDIECKHFKLWLTSAAVLERILYSGIFSDSDSHLERIRLRLLRYVPNPSFDRAKALLDKSHFCIVAGIPGIGKTTLAEVLLADLVDRQRFTAFRIANELSELRSVKNPKSKQVFYFDDFLGKTALDKLQKNEDQRLVELMEEVAVNPNWRFILTTREYILNIAKRQHEAFAHPPLNFQMCVVNLSDYARPIRAKILYNHIYFSDLPREYKLALLDEHGYEKILNHRNYNPRVIEYMTAAHHASAVASTLYLKEFVDSLDNPTRIWDHAFRHQISEPARNLLLVLTTVPDEVTLEDLEKAFWKFYEFRQKRFGFSARPGDWIDALRELDGNFIKTGKRGASLVVSFHNPSVKDFMENFLEGSDSDVVDLFKGAFFYEQYASLWAGVHERRYRGIERAGSEFLKTLAANLWGPSSRIIRVVNHEGETIGVQGHPPSNESRTVFFIQVIDELRPPEAAKSVELLLSQLSDLWKKGSADREDLVSLLKILTKRGMREDELPFLAARQCLLSLPETNDDFRAAADFYKEYPDAVTEDELDILGNQFLRFASKVVQESDDDPDWLRQIAGDLEYIGNKLNLPTEEFTQGLIEQAEEIEYERAEQVSPDDDERDWHPSDSRLDDVQAMFDGLKNDLRNT
ncbi:MAG: restriction endonuclease [Victivallales bacterium]|nr:restriction endonuclease [Victivallales bacterium]